MFSWLNRRILISNVEILALFLFACTTGYNTTTVPAVSEVRHDVLQYVPIAGGCGAAMLLLTATIIFAKVVKRSRESETFRGEARRTRNGEYEEHVNAVYGRARAGDTAHAGTEPRRNASAHDGSDLTVSQDNEYVTIDDDALAVPRAAPGYDNHAPGHENHAPGHENHAPGRSRHRGDMPPDFSDHGDVYSIADKNGDVYSIADKNGDVYSIADKKRRQNALADSRGNENASADERKHEKAAHRERADPGEEYACLDRRRNRNTPVPDAVVDGDVYASVDKTQNFRSPAAAAGATKPATSLSLHQVL